MNNNELYHTCRWCKYFDRKTQTCVNDRAFGLVDDFDFSPFYEDGVLSEAITEGFKNIKFDELENALIESKLSKKRIAEIMLIFNNELDDAFVNWTESIDGSVSTALNNFDFDLSGVEIKDPHDFHCKYFF